MATGRLGAADLSATTNTSLYTVPSSTRAVFTLSMCNRTTSAVTVRVALSSSGTPSNSDYIEYDTTLPGNGVLERSGLVLAASQICVVRASATGISAVCWGYEEPA